MGRQAVSAPSPTSERSRTLRKLRKSPARYLTESRPGWLWMVAGCSNPSQGQIVGVLIFLPLRLCRTIPAPDGSRRCPFEISLPNQTKRSAVVPNNRLIARGAGTGWTALPRPPEPLGSLPPTGAAGNQAVIRNYRRSFRLVRERYFE